ncbi:ATP-dependent helicase, partial [Nonomuraea sp. NPDC049695]
PVQRPTDFAVRLRQDLTLAVWREAKESAADGELLVLPDVDRRAVTGLKFATVLPERLAVATVAIRLADFESAKTALMEPVRPQHLGGH